MRMRLMVAPAARALGLRHVQAWQLSSAEPLLSVPGLSEDDVAALRQEFAVPAPPGYRALLGALGYPDTVPAGERLTQLVDTRGWRSHGAIVDAVSVATLCHGGGIGLHRVGADDADQLLTVTRAVPGQRITPAFSSRSKPIPAGDLVYGSERDGADGPGFEAFAWLGARDCDSAGRQLTDSDRTAILVALGCPGDDIGHTTAIGVTVARIRPDIGFSQVEVGYPGD